MLILSIVACAPREVLLPKLGIEVPVLREFPEGFVPPESYQTNQPVTGWGGARPGEPGGVTRTPVIFVHGNTVSARYWLPARDYFKAKGYTGDELWAVGYGWDTVRRFDSNDLAVPTLEKFINSVVNDIHRRTGKRVPQVDVIGHSLGVTVVRQWMKQENAWHRVRNFIGACGANHGVWTARMDARGQNRTVAFELAHGSPWLEQLNRGGEAPGPTRYMTLYDGTGWADVLFPPWSAHSSALKGAYNLAYNLEHGTHYDHLELPRVPETMDAMLKFLGELPPAPDDYPAPRLLHEDARVKTDLKTARVHCATGGEYPSRATAGETEVTLEPGVLTTCFAFDPQSGLASPMQRFKRPRAASAPGAEPLTVSASLPTGVYEDPITVELKASDPEAFIVYTTSGSLPNSGSPLYEKPVYVPGTLTLSAMAIAPDGRRSAPLQLRYVVSLEYQDAVHSLQRQFDPGVDIQP
ncbi:MAG TPA: chitobiase/beta-hexosaminidase C-terminal domain-containing protein [Nevskiales bacterium]|nr:chitobiase/beta-hexosaminidase C-terminal domain-containing protein [Nevskiales bacterium]